MTSARTIAVALVCFAAPLPTATLAADRARVSVTGVTVDAMEEPLGLDDAQPRLAWRLESPERGVMQSSYRVRVASSPVGSGEYHFVPPKEDLP